MIYLVIDKIVFQFKEIKIIIQYLVIKKLKLNNSIGW